jgi:hypothetical protein
MPKHPECTNSFRLCCGLFLALHDSANSSANGIRPQRSQTTQHTPHQERDDDRKSSAANGLAVADYEVVGTGLAGSVIAERPGAEPGARYLGR